MSKSKYKNMSGFSKSKLIWGVAGVLLLIAVIILSIYFYNKAKSPTEEEIISGQLREMEKIVNSNDFQPASEETLDAQMNEMNNLEKENEGNEAEGDLVSEQTKEMENL